MDLSRLSQQEIDVAKQALNIIVSKGVLPNAALVLMCDGDSDRASKIKAVLIDSNCARWSDKSESLRPTDESKDRNEVGYIQSLHDASIKKINAENLDETYKNKTIDNMRFTRIISIVAICVSFLSLFINLLCG